MPHQRTGAGCSCRASCKGAWQWPGQQSCWTQPTWRPLPLGCPPPTPSFPSIFPLLSLLSSFRPSIASNGRGEHGELLGTLAALLCCGHQNPSALFLVGWSYFSPLFFFISLCLSDTCSSLVHLCFFLFVSVGASCPSLPMSVFSAPLVCPLLLSPAPASGPVQYTSLPHTRRRALNSLGSSCCVFVCRLPLISTCLSGHLPKMQSRPCPP